jgi:hypothetical protein
MENEESLRKGDGSAGGAMEWCWYTFGPRQPRSNLDLACRNHREFSHRSASMKSSQAYSDYQRLDVRSLAMHCLVARELLANPAKNRIY